MVCPWKNIPFIKRHPASVIEVESKTDRGTRNNVTCSKGLHTIWTCIHSPCLYRQGYHQTGSTCVELHLSGSVLERIPGYEHLRVHVLTALADVGGQGGDEAHHVEAELVGRADGEPAHDRQQAQVHVKASHLNKILGSQFLFDRISTWPSNSLEITTVNAGALLLTVSVKLTAT